MTRRSATLTLIAALVLACASLAFAQGAQDFPYPNPTRMLVTLPQHPQTVVPATNLTQWNGSFTDLTHAKHTFTMVGTDPSKTDVTSTIPVFVIPIKMVFDKNHGNHTFDPNKNKFKGQSVSVTKTITNSPIFKSNVDFVQGGTNLGKTQYIDAFQRGNFWGKNVKKNNKYHVLLGKVTVLAEQTIHCNTSDCAVGNEFGKTVGLMDINHFDAIVQGYISKFTQIQPNTLPIFLTYDNYLTSGGCCIGGYHSANGSQPGGQTYSVSTVVDQGSGVFSQDTAALSHEIGEWMDDPFVDNQVRCNDNSILEVGDPLVLDDHPYTVNGFTYHLQDLVFLGYFGAPTSTSVHKWLSFQNDEKHVCPGQ
jgi:hypothetical protein